MPMYINPICLIVFCELLIRVCCSALLHVAVYRQFITTETVVQITFSFQKLSKIIETAVLFLHINDLCFF